MTFSIIARCPRTGHFGAAVASSSPAVASRCIRARAGVGAAVSQNITDPALGVMALDLMSQGMTPQQALERLREEPHVDYRQLMAIDKVNPPVAFTGASALGTLESTVGEHAACAGNMLASRDVPQAMLRAFVAAQGSLAERLMKAMLAGQEAGGEEGPVHSAGLLVVGDLSWPSVDLRVDWVDNEPVECLYKIWKVYEPQEQAYITRAKNPTVAPSFGVPGNL
jgi:uncharacterized Ntn-hydrolase superfamily protein